MRAAIPDPGPPLCLRECAEAAEEWLFEKALPLWLRQGVDWVRGGFYEALERDGKPSPGAFKRLRVAARQIYVFAEGAGHGLAGAAEAVEQGLDFILTKMRHPQGGFASRCDLDGRILDPTRDLYDMAFMLFALAHAYRLTHNATWRREALDLLSFIQVGMRHHAGGYCESLPPRLPRRQNPHMHLLEAALACIEYMPDRAFTLLCEQLVDLYQARFFDPLTGTLGEYYHDDWRPIGQGGKAVIEPGHHFEWAWLLAEVERLCGRKVPGGGALSGFALRYGVNPSSALLRGELFANGAVASGTVRIWPHCEWLKAALAGADGLGSAGDPVVAWQALAQFLDTPVPGLWLESWEEATGAFCTGPSPASSLYHITSAVTALRRAAL